MGLITQSTHGRESVFLMSGRGPVHRYSQRLEWQTHDGTVSGHAQCAHLPIPLNWYCRMRFTCDLSSSCYRLSRLRLHDRHSLTHLTVDRFCGVGRGPLAPSELNPCVCSPARGPPSELISSSRANPPQTHFVSRLLPSQAKLVYAIVTVQIKGMRLGNTILFAQIIIAVVIATTSA